MSTGPYRVILEGTIRDGHERPRVVKNLAALFKKGSQDVERLLSGRPRAIRIGVDRETALKYVQIIEKAGAAAHMEREAQEHPTTDVAQQLEAISAGRPEVQSLSCPRCGYRPTRQDDVMLVRGDCPRCGLLVQRIADLDPGGPSEEEFAGDFPEESEAVYGVLVPASWERRAMASAYTFGIFLLIYYGIVLFFMLVFLPLESLPIQVGRNFLFVAANNFPLILTSLSICIVTLVAPIFMRGRTWGQRAFDIVVLYPEEGGFSGQLIALTYRTAAVMVLSYAPGLLWMEIWTTIWAGVAYPLVVVVLMAVLAWSGAWYFAYRSPDKRGVLDIVARCIQTEENLLSRKLWLKALRPLCAAVVVLVVMGVVLPLLMGE